MHLSFRPKPVGRAAEFMSGFAPEWALCGGWALDSWIGRQTREHHDVDIAAFEGDQRAIFEYMAGWKLVGHDDEVADDSEELWDGRRLVCPAHIHARDSDEFELEFHLNERASGAWIFSREPMVAKPLQQCVAESSWGVRAVVPEVILYYKALPPGWRGLRPPLRPHDERDFSLLLPLLDATQRAWVARAISSIDPDHPWLRELS